jgi:hypothetical protein
MVQDDGPVGLDGVRVQFDDERVVSDAGIALVATLAERLGVEALAQRLVRLRRDRPGAASAGRKVMWPDWRHFCFITNRDEDIKIVEAEHRDHAVVEQVIADLKDQALAHFPSGHFHANAAWTVLAVLAHNLLRWTQLLGLPDTTVRAARTLRRRLLAVPGRLTRHARGWTLHLPARWPWARRLHKRAERDPRPARRRLTPAHAPAEDQHAPSARRARSPLGADATRPLHASANRPPTPGTPRYSTPQTRRPGRRAPVRRHPPPRSVDPG